MFSATQEIVRILWILKFYESVYNGPPLVPILCQMPDEIDPTPSRPVPLMSILISYRVPSRFLTEITYIFHLSRVCPILRPTYLSWSLE